MDKSKEYIDMVEKAVEIQKFKPNFDKDDHNFVANFHNSKHCPTHGSDHLWTKDLKHDFYCPNCGKELVSSEDVAHIETYEGNEALKSVWLPRQDQLQGMLYNEDRPRAWDLFCDFDEFIITHSREVGDYTLSAEQLWLAFVMHEKYGKKWNGKDWIKEEYV